MEVYRVEATLEQDGHLTLDNRPLQAGESVEVIILVKETRVAPQQLYSLRGTPVTYLDPMKPVVPEDWEVEQ